jgi:pimeloyl-ACP methyl ester carboxylesterase
VSSVQITDPSRPVVRYGVVVADRRYLPTVVWRPSAGGSWPLVVFVHGFDVGPMTYARFCSTLASAGYLVAAPAFPLEDPSSGYGLDEGDLPNEATDVSYVISTLEAGPLSRWIDRHEVAVVGHSDGADVALMVGYASGKRDPRVRAVVADAPDPIAGPIVQSGLPLLLIQGNADDINPYTNSVTVFSQLTGPRYFMTLLGAGHLPPIAGGTAWTPVLDAGVAAFLDSSLSGRSPGGSLLQSALSSSRLVHLEVGGT